MEEEEEKVRLFYTVYLSEVPDEIAKRVQGLEELNEQIKSKLKFIDKNVDTDDPYIFLRQITNVNKKLNKMGIMLQDLVEIRNGYYNYLNNAEAEKENNQPTTKESNSQVRLSPDEGRDE